jgi:F-type H+-transporting ATPase subunit epsilon
MSEATNTFHFELVSPEKKLLSEPVHMVSVPGEEGDFGVLANHSALLSSIRPGVIEIHANDNDQNPRRYFLAGGFADVTPTSLTVLAEQATPVEELDKAEIEKQLDHLKQDLGLAESEGEKAQVQKKIEIAEAKLFVLGH